MEKQSVNAISKKNKEKDSESNLLRERMKKQLLERKPIFCRRCSGAMVYQDSGIYQCDSCGAIDYDDFGKIKRYIEENGATNAVVLNEETGVPIDIINYYLREGRLEIPENSDVFIRCERCGCHLRYGRFCYECKRELTGKLQVAFMPEVGEKPKSVKNKKTGEMHFLKKTH